MIILRITLPYFVHAVQANWHHALFCSKQDFLVLTTVNINSLNTDTVPKWWKTKIVSTIWLAVCQLLLLNAHTISVSLSRLVHKHF